MRTYSMSMVAIVATACGSMTGRNASEPPQPRAATGSVGDPESQVRRRAAAVDAGRESRQDPPAKSIPGDPLAFEAEMRKLLSDTKGDEVLRQLAAIGPAMSAKVSLLLLEADACAQTLQEQRMFDCLTRALELADEALLSNPGSPDALSARAHALAGLARQDEFAAAIERALQASPDDQELQLHHTLRLALQSDATGFWRELDRVAKRDRAPLPRLMLRASMEKRAGFPVQALETYTAVLRLNPGHCGALASAAACHGDLGNHDRQLALASRALNQCPNLILARISQAEALIHMGRFAQAVAVLDGAIKLQPTLAQGHFLRAIAFSSSGQSREALAAFETSIQQWPQDADVYANLAKLHYQMGDAQRALAACDQALTLNVRWGTLSGPTLANVHADRACVLCKLDRPEAALAAADLALAINPGNSNATTNRQVALQMLRGR